MPKKKAPPQADQVSKAEYVGSDEAIAAMTNRPPEEGIGERIRRRREELRLNYEELARLTARCDYWDERKGLTSAMIARYEKGVQGKPVLPGARELRILCEALYVQPEWLLLGRDRQDHARGAVELARQVVSLTNAIQSYAMLDPSAKDENKWIWDQKLAEIKRPQP